MSSTFMFAIFVLFTVLSDMGDCSGCKIQTTSGKCCVFPFKYKGKYYYHCTTVDNGNTPWCSLTTDYNGQWGNCKTGQSSSGCKTRTTTNGKCCVFPFKYKKTYYYNCTTANNGKTPWCSLTPNHDKDFKWGNCKNGSTSTSSGHHLVNVALGKPTTQSSTCCRGYSNYAVDGNKNSNYRGKSCTATATNLSPWWRVDLQNLYNVRQVKITNRGDCCPERLSNFEIRVGNSLNNNGNANPACGGKYSLGKAETRAIACNPPLRGRYVNIVIPGKTIILTLCEVEVYA